MLLLSANWTRLPTMNRGDRTIDYRAGDEQAPSPVGKTILRIDAAGYATLEHRQRGNSVRWCGRVPEPVRLRFFEALALSAFPTQQSWPPPPPGETLRQLVLEGEPRESVMVPWHQAMKQPGYADAFRLLDQITGQLSAGAVRVVKDNADPLVADVERVPLV
jgi:hypothetical protein